MEIAALIAGLVSDAIKALAWPATILFILSRYRDQLSKLIDRIANESTRVSLLGAEAHFDRQSDSERERAKREDLSAIAESATPSIQETQPNAVPPTIPAKALPPTASHRLLRSQRRTDYLAAEELILREFERKWEVPLRREAAVSVPGGRLLYDAIAVVNDEVRLVEIRSIGGIVVPEVLLEQERDKLARAREALDGRVRLYLCILSTFDGLGKDKPVKQAVNFFAETDFPVTVEGFDLNRLLNVETDEASVPDR
jgi:hypothetical protein